MQDIPILEIDCNEEFHDNEEIKSKMLQQVKEPSESNIKTIQGARIRSPSAGETPGEAQLSQRD
jgi:hypothetical protein